MKYYRILDPSDLDVEKENKSVYLLWKTILDPCIEKNMENELDFLHENLINIPVLDDDGELLEKTVLLVIPIEKEEFENSLIQISVSKDLNVCYTCEYG